MLIYILAAAMTVAMLIATAVSLHQESQGARVKVRSDQRIPLSRSRRW